MAATPGLTPEDIREAQRRWVHVIFKNDAGQVEGEYDDTLWHVSRAIEAGLPEGWTADVTNI